MPPQQDRELASESGNKQAKMQTFLPFIWAVPPEGAFLLQMIWMTGGLCFSWLEMQAGWWSELAINTCLIQECFVNLRGQKWALPSSYKNLAGLVCLCRSADGEVTVVYVRTLSFYVELQNCWKDCCFSLNFCGVLEKKQVTACARVVLFVLFF